MKEKMVVCYVKNGKEYQVDLNFWNMKRTVKEIFVNPFCNLDFLDYYQIKEGVTNVYFKNVTFYQEVKFICPKDTYLILDHCHFRGNVIHFVGGNVQVIGPQLPQAYYSNRIFGSEMESFICYVEDKNSNYLSLSVDANFISISGSQRLVHLYLKGHDIHLKNIYGLKSNFLCCDHLEIQNSDMNICSVACENPMEKIEVHEDLTLIKSCLGAYQTLSIDCPSVSLDEQSYLYSYHHLQVGGKRYENFHVKDLPIYLYQSDLGKDQVGGVRKILKK